MTGRAMFVCVSPVRVMGHEITAVSNSGNVNPVNICCERNSNVNAKQINLGPGLDPGELRSRVN